MGGQRWSDILPEEMVRQGCELAARAQSERERGEVIYPAQENIFRALTLTPPEKVKVCIVGQDPYHEAGQATGLAFSVPKGVTIPPSLRNIFQELHTDLGCPVPASGDLSPWAERGVLLLNTALTVKEGSANSHAGWGWQDFTHSVFKACTQLPQPVVFILWGGSARAFIADLLISQMWEQKKACIWSSHPSPLGARKGSEAVPAFIGSRPFSKANTLLEQMGGAPINWSL